jgi:hypothetical protein
MFLSRLQGESVERFLEQNPVIESCYGAGLNQEGDRKFDIIFDVAQVSAKFHDNQKTISMYFEYINSVVNLYAYVCGGRNMEACNLVRDRVGCSTRLLLMLCSSDQKEEVKILSAIKASFITLVRVLVLEMLPFVEWNDY